MNGTVAWRTARLRGSGSPGRSTARSHQWRTSMRTRPDYDTGALGTRSHQRREGTRGRTAHRRRDTQPHAARRFSIVTHLPPTSRGQMRTNAQLTPAQRRTPGPRYGRWPRPPSSVTVSPLMYLKSGPQSCTTTRPISRSTSPKWPAGGVCTFFSYASG